MGDGNIHFNLVAPVGMAAQEFAQYSGALADAALDVAQELGGSFAAEHGIGRLKTHTLEERRSPIELGMMRTIRNGLDPQRLLNPGRVFENLPVQPHERRWPASVGEAGDLMPNRLTSSGDAMDLRALDHEVLRRCAFRNDLWPDAAVAHLQGLFANAGPIAADGLREIGRFLGIYLIIDGVDPLDIRPEPRPAFKIERQMRAEPARHRNGIDEPRNGAQPANVK